MLAAVLLGALLLARAWARTRELMLPIGFTVFLLGMIRECDNKCVELTIQCLTASLAGKLLA